MSVVVNNVNMITNKTIGSHTTNWSEETVSCALYTKQLTTAETWHHPERDHTLVYTSENTGVAQEYYQLGDGVVSVVLHE